MHKVILSTSIPCFSSKSRKSFTVSVVEIPLHPAEDLNFIQDLISRGWSKDVDRYFLVTLYDNDSPDFLDMSLCFPTVSAVNDFLESRFCGFRPIVDEAL